MSEFSFIRVPPDGSGKKLLASEYLDGGELVYAQGMNLVSPTDPHNMQEVDAEGQAFVRFVNGSPQFDSFGRMVTALNRVLFDVAFNLGFINGFHFYNTVSGAGTSAIDAVNLNSVLLTTGTASGDIAHMSSHRYFKYTPGYETGFVWTMAVGDTGKTGVVRRVGAFDADDGVFFQIDDTGLNVVVRDSLTGLETKVNQSAFSGDRMDGTGKSGLTLDITKDHIYWINYQWLGAGAVKFGVYANGNKIEMHSVNNFNTSSAPYMVHGDQKFTAEQENTGTAPSGSELRIFCISVSTTAPIDTLVNSRFKRIVTSTSANTNDEVHVISVRPRQFDPTGHVNRTAIAMIRAEFSAFMDQSAGTPNGLFRLTIVRDAVITGGDWTPIDLDAESNTTATSTGGAKVFSQLCSGDGTLALMVPPVGEPTSITRKGDASESQTFTLIVERIRGTEAFVLDAVYTMTSA